MKDALLTPITLEIMRILGALVPGARVEDHIYTYYITYQSCFLPFFFLVTHLLVHSLTCHAF